MARGDVRARVTSRAVSRRSPAAIKLTLALHGGLLALFALARGTATPASQPTALTVFDVALPPPPEPPPAPPPPMPPRPSPRPAGGKPPAASRPVPVPAEATPLPLAPSAPVRSPFTDDLGTALVDGGTALDGPGGAGEGRGGMGGGAGTGDGTGAGSGAPRYARAEWIYKPSLPDFRRHWPVEAARRRITGYVTLSCVVPRPGRPRSCRVVSERPSGFGFGRAAVAISPLFRIRPVFRDADVVTLPVMVPVVFAAAPVEKP